MKKYVELIHDASFSVHFICSNDPIGLHSALLSSALSLSVLDGSFSTEEYN